MNNHKKYLSLLLVFLTVIYQFFNQHGIEYNYPMYVMLVYGFYLIVRYHKEIL